MEVLSAFGYNAQKYEYIAKIIVHNIANFKNK